ncbi:hypothetical protein J6590_078745 [Homalodisca vitripennis]|nr:hypothetical protein J6590_078745 [Homalodisca vitripennis]
MFGAPGLCKRIFKAVVLPFALMDFDENRTILLTVEVMLNTYSSHRSEATDAEQLTSTTPSTSLVMLNTYSSHRSEATDAEQLTSTTPSTSLALTDQKRQMLSSSLQLPHQLDIPIGVLWGYFRVPILFGRPHFGPENKDYWSDLRAGMVPLTAVISRGPDYYNWLLPGRLYLFLWKNYYWSTLLRGSLLLK